MRSFLLPLLLATAPLATASDESPMFNGKDLTGWSGDPRIWRVENNTIIGETDATSRKIAANSFLIWQNAQPADFELEFEARVSGDNNSGVQYRSKIRDAATWSVTGYQMDLHPNAPYLAMFYEEGGRGISCLRGQKITLTDKPTVTGSFEIETVNLANWNRYRIVAKGNLLQHFVNGKLAAETTDNHPEKRATSGVIALQLHSGPPMKAEFKNFKLTTTKAP